MSKFFLLTILSAILFLNGCGNKSEDTANKKSGEQSETKSESKSEIKNETGKSEGEINKKTETGSEQSAGDENKSNELGMTPGLPKDFPQDVPQPKNSKTLGSLNSTEGTVVTFESADKVMDVINFYKEEMKKNGYTITEGSENIINDKGGLINWTKDKKEVGLMLGYDKDKNITSLVITYK